MRPELSEALALIAADAAAVVDTQFSNVDGPMATQILILAELRLIRAELVKANARGGALVSSGL